MKRTKPLRNRADEVERRNNLEDSGFFEMELPLPNASREIPAKLGRRRRSFRYAIRRRLL